MKGGKRWQKVVKGGGGRDMCCGRAGREKDGEREGRIFRRVTGKGQQNRNEKK